jgi:fibronectin-binding autotransporter adhesin
VQQTGGTINVAGDVSLGTGNTKSNATYSMGGGALHAKQIHVGQGGIGAFNTTGGTVTAAEAFMVSQVDGPRVGVGSGTQTGGVISADGWISIGTDAGTNGTYTLSGGSLNTLGDIPENRPGDFNVSDNAGSTGTLNLSGTGIAQGVTVYVGKNANTNGTVNQTGGTMRVGAGNLRIAVNDPTARGAYNLQGGVLDLQGHDIVVGPGTAAFTMTGGEIRNAGVVNLALNQQGGKLAPGDGAGNAGRSTLMAGYVLGAPGTLEIDVNGAAPGAGYDQLAVSGGGVSLAGSLATLVGFAPVLGEQFVILDNQGASAITGAFAGLPEGSVFSAGGARFQITYHGGDGNDVMLTAQAAPEPGAFAGGAIATAGLLLRRRCRRRA